MQPGAADAMPLRAVPHVRRGTPARRHACRNPMYARAREATSLRGRQATQVQAVACGGEHSTRAGVKGRAGVTSAGHSVTRALAGTARRNTAQRGAARRSTVRRGAARHCKHGYSLRRQHGLVRRRGTRTRDAQRRRETVRGRPSVACGPPRNAVLRPPRRGAPAREASWGRSAESAARLVRRRRRGRPCSRARRRNPVPARGRARSAAGGIGHSSACAAARTGSRGWHAHPRTCSRVRAGRKLGALHACTPVACGQLPLTR